MNTILSSLLVMLFTCGTQKGPATEQAVADTSLFTLAEAEKILGEPAHLTNGTDSFDPGFATDERFVYTANDTDRVSGKLGVIYFLVQTYTTVAGAHERYAFIKKANENHGIETLTGVGEEAYFHTDGENFLFIMARKGMKVLTMKVNKTTSHTSRAGFDEVARRVVGRM
jgi:hypothetical protein